MAVNATRQRRRRPASARLVAARRRVRDTGVDFGTLCVVNGLPKPVPEYAFALGLNRNFRFDFAWPSHYVALEIEGGILQGGGHTYLEGILRDLEKHSLGAVLGWRIVRCLPVDAKDGSVIELIRRALEAPRRP